jgi:large-conductance mechanosensitive channel
MDGITGQLTMTIAAFVLSSSTGLRAYLPIFALGLAAATGVIPHAQTALGDTYGALTNPIVLTVLGALSVLELVADKVPGVDHVSDVIHTAIRPVMGAIIFAGTNNVVSHANPVLAGAIGLALAGGVHATKALAVRPTSTVTTAGIGNPVISIIEDVVSVVMSALAVFAPIIALILFLIFAVLVFFMVRWGIRRLRQRRQRKQAAKMAQTVSQGSSQRTGRG